VWCGTVWCGLVWCGAIFEDLYENTHMHARALIHTCTHAHLYTHAYMYLIPGSFSFSLTHIFLFLSHSILTPLTHHSHHCHTLFSHLSFTLLTTHTLTLNSHPSHTLSSPLTLSHTHYLHIPTLTILTPLTHSHTLHTTLTYLHIVPTPFTHYSHQALMSTKETSSSSPPSHLECQRYSIKLASSDFFIQALQAF
jgi:hypothetical protein